MGLYTVLDDPAVDAMVQEHLETIAAGFRKAVPSLQAVLITGGFGRGEGSVVVEEKPRPLNDYDMAVIVPGNARYRRHRLEQAAQEIGDTIGVTVDVGTFDAPRLRKLPPTILIYEIRDGHHVVSGDGADLRWPEFTAADLPLEEGTDLLFNRGMSLLRSRLARLEEWPETYPLGTRRQCAIHIQKAILAWGDAAILAAGRYDGSYRRRAEIIGDLDDAALPPIAGLRERYRSAVERKLEPRPGDPDGADAVKLDATIDDHEIAFRWFEERRLGHPIETWTRYRQLVTPRTVLPRDLGELLRNPLRNFRAFRWAAKLDALHRPPRDTLIAVFPSVLFGSGADPRIALGSLGLADDSVVAAREFLALWH